VETNLQAKPSSEGAATNAHQDNVGLDLLLLTALGSLGGDKVDSALLDQASDLGAQLELEPLLLQGALEGFPR